LSAMKYWLYISCYRDRANTDALRRVVLNSFSAEEIGMAKKLLLCEFQSKLTTDALWTEHRSSTSRAAHDAEVEDILLIFDTLDTQNTLKDYFFGRYEFVSDAEIWTRGDKYRNNR